MGGEFIVTITKLAGIPVGIDFDMSDSSALYVKSVESGGFVEIWNEAQKASGGKYQVEPGDRIVEVNGNRGDLHEFIDTLLVVESVTLTIHRASQTTICSI